MDYDSRHTVVRVRLVLSDLSNLLSSPSNAQFHLPLLEPGILDQRYMRVLSMLEHELGTLELQGLSRLITNMLGGYHSFVTAEIRDLATAGLISEFTARRMFDFLQDAA